MHKFEIAGIRIRLSDLSADDYEQWAKFLKGNSHSKEADIVLKRSGTVQRKYELCYFDFPTELLVKHIIAIDADVLLADKNWLSGEAFIQDDLKCMTAFADVMFYAHAVRRHMLQIHCSIVEYKGVGILFLGPSGIGKTTQAERWAEYRNALIINGDIGYVEDTGNGFLAWGTPWHGSSPYCVNTSVPIVAMVVLKQAGENRLRRLSGFEMVTEVSGSVFYPTWLEDGMELCTATLNDLLTTVPVYLLENKADEEAVNLLADELGLS